MIKDEVEIADAARSRDAARRRSPAGPRVRPGGPNRAVRVAAEIDSGMREAGFSRPAFETIVASGPNSVLPHARPTDRVVQAGDPTVLDFGGVYDGYCVDLTRTVQLGAAVGGAAATVCGGRRGPEGGHRGGSAGRGVQRDRRGGPNRAANGTGLGRRSVMGRGTVSGSRCTRSRGSPASRPGCPTMWSSRAWCSRSSRALTSRASAACGSRTTSL